MATMQTRKKCCAVTLSICLLVSFTAMCPCGKRQSSTKNKTASVATMISQHRNIKNSSIERQLDPPHDVTNPEVDPPDDVTNPKVRQCQDEECRRFVHLLEQWPPGKPKAAIYFLVQPGSRMKNLKKSLQALDMYFNSRFRYPVILFHERAFINEKAKVQKMTSSNVFFQEVHFSVPKFLPKPVPLAIPCISPMSYRHMCRFQAKTVYEEPILQGLDYYWRLDDDSFILQPIAYDVFRFMRDNSKRYGYIWRHVDGLHCTEGLWDAARTHIAKHNIHPQFFHKWEDPSLYYNNFEISETKLWLSEQYKKFINDLDKLGGIYYNRWGDAPIKGIAVSIFIAENDTHYFSDIAYQHNTFKNKPTEKRPFIIP